MIDWTKIKDEDITSEQLEEMLRQVGSVAETDEEGGTAIIGGFPTPSESPTENDKREDDSVHPKGQERP